MQPIHVPSFTQFRLLPLPPTSAGPFDAPPASPLWSFGGTPVPTPVSTPVWQCFQVGCRIKFLLPNTAAPWQKAEELAWKDHVAMKVDARNSYQYAPNGLILLQVSGNVGNRAILSDRSRITLLLTLFS